jgi:hypothetical protein
VQKAVASYPTVWVTSQRTVGALVVE